MSKITNPCFTTFVRIDICLKPSQMDNNAMQSLRNNITDRLLNKCLKNYGFVSHIYDMDEIKGGLIVPEDNSGSALFRIKVECKMINVPKNSIIVAKILGINNTIILADNGPIRIIIPGNKVNENKIVYSHKNAAFFSRDENGKIVGEPINKGSHVIVKIVGKLVIDGTEKIVTIGILESVATDEEVKQFIDYQYCTKIPQYEKIEDYLEENNELNAKSKLEIK
jgi:DNA-directed RNA polymerase subunit E'/Rpb7